MRRAGARLPAAAPPQLNDLLADAAGRRAIRLGAKITGFEGGTTRPRLVRSGVRVPQLLSARIDKTTRLPETLARDPQVQQAPARKADCQVWTPGVRAFAA